MAGPYFARNIRTDAQWAAMPLKQRIREIWARRIGAVKEGLRSLFPAKTGPSPTELAVSLSVSRKLKGDYVEFGCYTGRTTIRAYHLFRDHGREDIRIFAFDSFAGIPELTQGDQVRYLEYQAGYFACSEAEYLRNVTRYGVPRSQVIPVAGTYDKTCNPETARDVGLEKIAVVHIDCDVFSSTLTALRFVGPLLEDGAMIIFDDWDAYRSHPELGERGALAVWEKENPHLLISHMTQLGAVSVHRRLAEAERARLNATV